VRQSNFVFILNLCFVLTTSQTSAQEYEQNLDPARRAYVASRLYAAIQQYFAHWEDVPDLDIDNEFKNYLREAMVAKNRLEFTLASLAFVVRLRNSHSGFTDNDLFKEAGKGHGFAMRCLEGEWVVTESNRSDLSPGDVLREIDGQPIDEFYSDKARYISASTERFRRHRLFDWWRRYLFPLRYTLRLSDGRTVKIDRSGEENPPEKRMETEGRWLEDDRIAYIRVPSWNNKRFQERAMELVQEFRSARELIIDVRGNSGGSSPIRFISALMERPWRWWAESTPMQFGLFSYYARSRSAFEDFTRPSMAWPASVQQPDSVFTGRAVILIDEGCHSACEDFVMPFKDNNRAVLVGEATAASTGQPAFISFGDGMGVAVGTKREYFPAGWKFEGVGIMPDIRVVPTPEDLQAGRDVELEKALEVLRER